MKEKLQSALGGFGVILYFLLSWLICFYPLLFCGFPWWGDVIYIALIVFLGGTFLSGICSTAIYVIALINVLRSPIDVWSIIFLVLFAVNILYFILNFSLSHRKEKQTTSSAPSGASVHSSDRSPALAKSSHNTSPARPTAFSNSFKAGGNVGYIAQNVATIYHCICRYADKENKYTTAQRIYAALLIDSIAYLQSGQISSSELQTSVHAAALRQIGANHFYRQELYGIACYPDNAHLICATADLEVLMFCADSNLDYHSVIDFVARSIGTIESMVHRTLAQGDASPLFSSILPTVLTAFHQPDFLSGLDEIDF